MHDPIAVRSQELRIGNIESGRGRGKSSRDHRGGWRFGPTPLEDWEEVASVHGEFFGGIRPANTVMQVVRFIDPDWLVEIEADALIAGLVDS